MRHDRQKSRLDIQTPIAVLTTDVLQNNTSSGEKHTIVLLHIEPKHMNTMSIRNKVERILTETTASYIR